MRSVSSAANFRGGQAMADQATKSILVKANVKDVYNLWAHFENFPHFMKYIKSVTTHSNGKSHWVMEGPLGKDIEWEAQTTRMEPEKRIAWNSTDGDIKTSGQVTFNTLPHDETQVTVMMHYEVPAGKFGEAMVSLFSDPDKRIEQDLKNFKAYAEGMHERTQSK
jgi:uncharacterized membrane protein